MENNLLKKEQEFHKLNAELELKTKELLKEIEGVMNIQDKIPKRNKNSYASLQTSSSSDDLSKVQTVSLQEAAKRTSTGSSRFDNQPFKHDTKNNRQEFSQHSTSMDPISSVQVSVADDVLPEASLVRCLRAKVRALQDEVSAMQNEYKQRTDAWRQLQRDLKATQEERTKWQQQAGALRDALQKQEAQNSTNVSKLEERDAENASLKKELEALRKELRTALQTSRSNEVRLQRALEEVDKLRGVLQAHDRDDKELRRRGDETVATVKRLEKQRAELLNGFRKQLQLIDNLKKQKAHLQAACAMQFCKEEFLQLLDWCPTKP
ncbi:testis-expressed protein 9 [Periplaneta americana]|uniref:testis-expressed protein 9 n=1 Tax=Periplaneta americana TaxID=6978 RepID=UPI0037E7BCA6